MKLTASLKGSCGEPGKTILLYGAEISISKSKPMALKGDELLQDKIVISNQIIEEVRICKYL
jgi:hypothetical protein